MTDLSPHQSQLLKLLESGDLQLPGIPDIAQRVNDAIKNADFNISDLARVIQSDIPLTARMIQVANSPLYQHREAVEHLQGAVSRLGTKVTKNLVISFSLRRVFAAQTQVTKKIARDTWKDSVKLAVIAYTIARVTPKLDPDAAMLAGLVYYIGVLAIIAYVEHDSTPPMNFADVNLLVETCHHKAGALVLTKWRFDTEFVTALLHGGEWNREHEGNADYADVLVVAQLLNRMSDDDSIVLTELPVYQKFPLFRLGPGAAKELLEEAKQEMEDLTKLLNTA